MFGKKVIFAVRAINIAKRGRYLHLLVLKTIIVLLTINLTKKEIVIRTFCIPFVLHTVNA